MHFKMQLFEFPDVQERPNPKSEPTSPQDWDANSGCNLSSYRHSGHFVGSLTGKRLGIESNCQPIVGWHMCL
jgi:hypothetical protein